MQNLLSYQSGRLFCLSSMSLQLQPRHSRGTYYGMETQFELWWTITSSLWNNSNGFDYICGVYLMSICSSYYGYLEDSCLLNHELILLLAAPWWRGSAHRTGWPWCYRGFRGCGSQHGCPVSLMDMENSSLINPSLLLDLSVTWWPSTRSAN